MFLVASERLCRSIRFQMTTKQFSNSRQQRALATLKAPQRKWNEQLLLLYNCRQETFVYYDLEWVVKQPRHKTRFDVCDQLNPVFTDQNISFLSSANTLSWSERARTCTRVWVAIRERKNEKESNSALLRLRKSNKGDGIIIYGALTLASYTFVKNKNAFKLKGNIR